MKKTKEQASLEEILRELRDEISLNVAETRRC